MKKCVELFMVLTAVLLFTACSTGAEEKITYDFYEKEEIIELYPVEYNMENQTDVTGAEMTSHFQQYYGWKHLLRQKLYWNEKDEVQLEFEFSKDVDLWEIEAANHYVVDTFINKKINNNLIHEYQSWGLGKEFQKIFAQVYVEDKLITQEYFEKKGSDFEHTYYETSDVLLEKQKFEPENKKELEKAIFEQFPEGDGQISYRMDLSQTCIIVSINTFSQIDPENLTAIETSFSTMIGEKKDILLELYCDEELYYQRFISSNDNEQI